MEKTFDDVKKHIINDITEQTAQVLKTLTNLWIDTFAEKECITNAEKLAEHVTLFYGDIVGETKEREKKIKARRDRLYDEAQQLKTILTSDIDLTPDIPLYPQQLYLAESLSSLQVQLEERTSKIESLLAEQQALCDELGECAKQLRTEPVLPTQNDLDEFRQYLDDLIKEKQARYNESEKSRHKIIFLGKKLGNFADNLIDARILNHPKPLTKECLAQFNSLRHKNQKLYNSMQVDIDKMKVNLASIWDYFGIKHQNEFDNADYSYQTFKDISQQLLYWEEKRESHIREILTEIRKEIVDWWNATLCSDLDKTNFTIFTSNSYTEELLEAHEDELQRLKYFYFQNEKLFCLIEKRKVFWHRLLALDKKANDPNRFKNRGGKLLMEEKERNKISTQLPNIENEILVLAEEYMISTKKPFTVHGVPVANIINGDWKQRYSYREIISNPRRLSLQG